jgi:hypothetical protein
VNRRLSKEEDLKVFITSKESKCDECKEDLGSKAWIVLAGERGAWCLSCADLDHLVFLPSGAAALSRRARGHSTLSAVVLKWSKARQRYERQGLLVEEAALQRAEIDCSADEEARVQRRLREAERRAELDLAYVSQFAERVRRLYPKCPVKTATAIAEHACAKYSGRVGRSAAAKALDRQAVRWAVVAHVRHVETPYDELLMNGWERIEARHEVEDAVHAVLAEWQKRDDG